MTIAYFKLIFHNAFVNRLSSLLVPDVDKHVYSAIILLFNI